MWVWSLGGLVTVGFTLAGGPRPDDATVAVAPTHPPRVVRFDEPPLAKALRTPPAVRYSSPSDPF